MAKKHLLLLLLAVITVAALPEGTLGVSLDHIVGGSFGWRLPPNQTFYQEWARDKTFVVGDKLVFMYTPALQNVLEVPKKDFEDCTERNVIEMYYAGPTVLQINKSGTHYFYCGIGTHCEGGQKITIDVSATAVPDPARDGLPAALAPGDANGTQHDVAAGQDGAKSAAAGGGVRGGGAVVAGLLIALSVALLLI